MSLKLYWVPVVPQEQHSLGSHPVKGLLVKAFGEGDGSLRTEFTLTESDLPALRMLLRTNGDRQAGEVAAQIANGIEAVVDAIHRYGAIRLFTDE